jgi:hypothetical protein
MLFNTLLADDFLLQFVASCFYFPSMCLEKRGGCTGYARVFRHDAAHKKRLLTPLRLNVYFGKAEVSFSEQNVKSQREAIDFRGFAEALEIKEEREKLQKLFRDS